MIPKRSERWALASMKIGKIENYLIVITQSLGELDSKLILEDERLLKKIPENPDDPDWFQTSRDLGSQITLSYLWVLGAYELIRTLDQRCREKPDVFGEIANKKINETKKTFERIRMPLAKLEPAKRYSSDDSHIAFPAMGPQGTAWHINEKTYINRRDLSDILLDLFEEISVK
jgi:hypothetical protein